MRRTPGRSTEPSIARSRGAGPRSPTPGSQTRHHDRSAVPHCRHRNRPGIWSTRCGGPGCPTSTTPGSPGRSTPPTPRSTGCCRGPSCGPGTSTRSPPALEVCRSLGVPLTARGRGHLHRRQRGRPGRRRRHQPPPRPGAGRRRRGADGDRRAGPGAGRAADRRPAARAALRARPEHAQPLHDRRDDRQQRLRLAGAGLRPHVGQRGRPRRRHRRRAAARGSTGTAAGDGVLDDLRRLVEGELATIRTELGRFGRQVSGYSLEHLLPERGFDVARALVGSEGTLALVLGATVRLVADAPFRGLVVLGYPTMADAADATPGLLPHAPDRRRGPGLPHRPAAPRRARGRPCRTCPAARRWLVVELTGDTDAEVTAKAGACWPTPARWTPSSSPTSRRRPRSGGSARTAPGSPPAPATGSPAHAGWEDAAVPAERLGAYLREFDALLAGHGLQGVPYGHFGDGCVHVRIDFPFGAGSPDRRPGAPTGRSSRTPPGWSPRYGGSLSGEHGDGRARSELLPLMYSPAVIAAVRAGQGAARPGRRAQPRRPGPAGPARRRRPGGRRPASARAASRWPTRTTAATSPPPSTGAPAWASAGPTCRAPAGSCARRGRPPARRRTPPAAGRGCCRRCSRRGGPVDGWRSPEVHDGARPLPVLQGLLPRLPDRRRHGDLQGRGAAPVLPAPAAAALALHAGPAAVLVGPRRPGAEAGQPRARLEGGRRGWPRPGAGIDQRREVPQFAVAHVPAGVGRPAGVPGGWHPGRAVGRLVHRPLRPARRDRGGAGARGGRLPRARAGRRHLLRAHLDHHRPAGHAPGGSSGARSRRWSPPADAGWPIVGVEPSCTAVLRGEALELVGGPAAERVAAATRTLAELLTATPGWQPPSLAGLEIVAQPHCHHASVLGWSADARAAGRRPAPG